tara:strand:+ start:210 stop:581 length:372 start_codon:yes stop_codon:yes gene_type:complete
LLFAFLFFNASATAAFLSSSVRTFSSPDVAFLASASFFASSAFAFAFAFFLAFLLALSPFSAGAYFASYFFSSVFSIFTSPINFSNSASSRAFLSFLDNYFAGFSSVSDKIFIKETLFKIRTL